MINKGLLRKLSLVCMALPLHAFALVFSMPPVGSSIVGKTQTITIQPDQNFFQISRKYDIGFEALVAANPKVNYDQRKDPQAITVPSRIALPPVPWHDIVINVAEMRLYYFTPDGKQVYIFPVGVGRAGWATPTAETKVIIKERNPVWHIPDSIRENEANQGTYFPDVIEPGPQDPLGAFALHLDLPGYLIHGTNDPNSIGAQSSSGCIRMYPEDIETLFNLAKKDMHVRIINVPYKVGVDGNTLELEAHPQFDNNQEKKIANVTPILQSVLSSQGAQDANINWHDAARVATEHSGIPQAIGMAKGLNIQASQFSGNSQAAPALSTQATSANVQSMASSSSNQLGGPPIIDGLPDDQANTAKPASISASSSVAKHHSDLPDDLSR